HRHKPGELEIRSPLVNAVVLGTEFNLTVGDDGTTRIDLLDGQVQLENALGTLSLKSGEAGLIEPGKAPARTAMIEAGNVIQWCLYYPAVLNVDELELSEAE